MLIPTDKIKELFTTFSKDTITSIDTLPQAGSERHYFRIFTTDKSFTLSMIKSFKFLKINYGTSTAFWRPLQ